MRGGDGLKEAVICHPFKRPSLDPIGFSSKVLLPFLGKVVEFSAALGRRRSGLFGRHFQIYSNLVIALRQHYCSYGYLYQAQDVVVHLSCFLPHSVTLTAIIHGSFLDQLKGIMELLSLGLMPSSGEEINWSY